MDDRTAQAQLTPEERRTLLRAFADRMLLKITAMDDPADMPGVERAVRVAAVIERVYSRCDRGEHQKHIEAPDLFKAEAERATHKIAAIEARVSLANTLKWGEERRLALGPWWDAAQSATHSTTLAPKSASQNPAAAVNAPGDPEQRVKTGHQTPDAPSDTSSDTAPDTGALDFEAPDTGASDTGASDTGASDQTTNAGYVDYTDCILEAQAAHRKRTAKPPPPA